MMESTGAGDTAATGFVAARRHLKARAVDEFVVLWSFLDPCRSFRLPSTRAPRVSMDLDPPMQGFALHHVAVFLGQVMMLFEIFDPGRWLRRLPTHLISTQTFSSPRLFLVPLAGKGD